MNRTILKLLAGFVSGAIFVFAGNVFLSQFFRDSSFVDGVAARWVSPEGLYNGASYELLIKGMDGGYAMVVSRVGNDGSYGHMFPVAFFHSPNTQDKMKSYIASSNVFWAEEGLNVETPSGHKIFLPAKMFLGGR